jgi:hypothetical protein
MIRGIVMTLCGVASLAGVLGLYGAFQIRNIQLAAQVEPQPISLAELIKNGASDNAHVIVSDFVFGKPFVEKESNAGSLAWVPLYVTSPQSRKPAPPPVVVRVRANDAELAEFLKSAAMTVVVANQMPSGSPWKIRLPTRFAEAYPEMKPTKTLLLTDPEISFMGETWRADHSFGNATQMFAWMIASALGAVGLCGLLWLGRFAGSAVAATEFADQSTKLATETAFSSHEFNTTGFASRGFKIFVFCGVLVAFLGLIFIAGVSLLTRKPESGLTIMAVSAGLMLVNAVIIWSHWRFRAHGVSRIDVCKHGLRWVKAGDDIVRFATWSQVANLELHHTSP